MVNNSYWWKVSTVLLGLCIMPPSEKMITVFQEIPAIQMAVMVHVDGLITH
jgi:hypothetical protein